MIVVCECCPINTALCNVVTVVYQRWCPMFYQTTVLLQQHCTIAGGQNLSRTKFPCRHSAVYQCDNNHTDAGAYQPHATLWQYCCNTMSDNTMSDEATFLWQGYNWLSCGQNGSCMTIWIWSTIQTDLRQWQASRMWNIHIQRNCWGLRHTTAIESVSRWWIFYKCLDNTHHSVWMRTPHLRSTFRHHFLTHAFHFQNHSIPLSKMNIPIMKLYH